jgi:Uncharacterized protein involved in tolerance to divalent cations
MAMLLVYITAPDGKIARSLGRALVRERLAACANIVDGMESFYWWDGDVQSARESICLCKTTEERYAALEKRVKELHPYEVPCIVAMPLTRGHQPFLDWLAAETAVKN